MKFKPNKTIKKNPKRNNKKGSGVFEDGLIKKDYIR